MDISLSDSISAKELIMLKSTRQKDLLRAVIVDNPDVEVRTIWCYLYSHSNLLQPLALAMLSRLDETHAPNPSTPPEWMTRATTVLSFRILNLLLPPEHQFLSVQHRDAERSRYTLSPKASSFLEIVCSILLETLPLLLLTVLVAQTFHQRTRMDWRCE